MTPKPWETQEPTKSSLSLIVVSKLYRDFQPTLLRACHSICLHFPLLGTKFYLTKWSISSGWERWDLEYRIHIQLTITSLKRCSHSV